jgi:bile-acid 7alpha-dehydratase
MVDLNEMENRLKIVEEECRRLKDIEAIKSLKCRYWHCVDESLWDDIAACFTEDTDIFGAKLEGKQLIARFFKRMTGKQYSITSHQGHNPEISLINDTQAIGRWQLDQFGIESSTGQAVKLGVVYHDEYWKERGSWKIKSTRVSAVYRQILNLGELPSWAGFHK